MTAPQIVQSIVVIFALLSAWAWAKSAMLQIRPDHKSGWIDSHLNRISRQSSVWNAIAAFLAAFAAITAAMGYLITMPR
jgi:hypothetical protein